MSQMIEDFLDEDPIITNQQYTILSYIIPSEMNELRFPLIKIRGSYKSIEECNKKIEKLKNTEKFFHLHVVETGKWGSLYSKEELEILSNEGDIETVYRESRLNELMKGLKESSEKKDLEFETRKMRLKTRADFENTPEGQEHLKNVKESPIAVKARMEFVDAELEKVKDQMRKLIDIKKTDNATIKEYTPEELAVLEKPIDNPLLGVEEKGKNTVTYNKIEEETEQIPELDPKNFDVEKFNKMFESKTGGSSLPDVGFGSNSSLASASFNVE
jgi:hypothetical protein